MDNLATLQMLFNQQLSEYREIQDLRGKVHAAEARHQKLGHEIQQLLVCDTVPPNVAPAPALEHTVRPSTQGAGSGIFNADVCFRCMRLDCICGALDFEPEEFGY